MHESNSECMNDVSELTDVRENCGMPNDLDLDFLDDIDFYQMRQLTTPCESHLYGVFHDQFAPAERFPQNGDLYQPEYSPLSSTVEDTSLVFNFPDPLPTLTDAAPKTSTSSFHPLDVDDVDTKPRRGRKRLPATVCIAYHIIATPWHVNHLMHGTLNRMQSNGLLFSSTVIGTLAVDGWAVTFRTAMRGLGGLRPAHSPHRCFNDY